MTKKIIYELIEKNIRVKFISNETSKKIIIKNLLI